MPSSGQRPKVAVVSAYNELCGIAGYARRLVGYLSEDFDIEVIPLDQMLLRARSPRGRKAAKAEIESIRRRLGQFDSVNFQFEPGTLGPTLQVACARLRTLVQACKRASITFHTFEFTDDQESLLGTLARGRWGRLRHMPRDHMRTAVWNGLVNWLIEQSGSGRVSLIVHTRREARRLKIHFGAGEVIDHPLAFLTDDEVRAFAAGDPRSRLPVARDLPADARLVGVFGFITEYKGTLTAIRALRHLPENYHLLIFGGVHPNSIQRRQKIDPFLASVIGEIEGYKAVDITDFDSPRRETLDVLRELHPSFLDRVHFMGAPDDDGFCRGIAACDHAVFPYLEVGQTSSGPISMAVELGRPVIAARNKAFLQYERYHPDRMDFFDIGNSLELAQRILHPLVDHTTFSGIGARSNRNAYRRAHGLPPLEDGPAEPVSGRDRRAASQAEPRQGAVQPAPA